MATDVDVQYFSHLNGLVLGNNWGDLIRLLDKTLVTGIAFTEITAASIDAQGDVHITLYSAHNALLFQIVELSGFTPNSLNQKYRIKGTPSATELILKPSTAIAEKSVTTKGTGKLASLGYEIVFRDQNDVKRVYRAKNPRAEHPFIRVDESLTSPDGTSGVYNSSYAKYAMVGLLENMTHIDDYENPEVLQLPFDPADPAKNWKITGTGANVVRGWSRWIWARSGNLYQSWPDSSGITNGDRNFTLTGDSNAFYLQMPVGTAAWNKRVYGAGLYDGSIKNSIDPSWFLMSRISLANASTNYLSTEVFGSPLVHGESYARFITPFLNKAQPKQAHSSAFPILPDFTSGNSDLYGGGSSAVLQIPFYDSSKILRGNLKHISYNGKNFGSTNATVSYIDDASMYIYDSAWVSGSSTVGSLVYYLGELE
ncbi:MULTISPECIES: hypothetical protein [Acinetobacter]|uniref:Uncharacterized protein n=1 Tax=Acinetobacter piscicola TaxID=2006115 RepID=A0A7S6VWF3_9GAMM|nr:MULTISPECIES: hypothetical protein [Acinetobacter]QOW46065.1 hypothetical protein G0028_09250 [Acinetobacter piscicola]